MDTDTDDTALGDAVTPELAIKRLMMIVSKLYSIEPRRFNFGSWVGADWGGADDLSCETDACALGWATTIDHFKKLGLRLSRPYGGTPMVTLDTPDGPFSAERTATQLFNVTSNEAYFLFIPHGSLMAHSGQFMRGPAVNASAKEVAQHIVEFIRWKWPTHVHLIVEPQTCA